MAEPTYSGALSFLRRRYTKDLTDCDIAVVGVPFDLATTNRPGARMGPRAIREASASLAWDPVWGWDFDPLDHLSVIDFGDVLFDPGEPGAVPEKIEQGFRPIHAAGVATIMLGGDHFSTYPVLKSVARDYAEPLSLIHFDAHSDTWRDENNRIDHGTMFFHAMNEGIIDPSTSAQIGIRTNNPETHGFNIVSAEDVYDRGPQSVVEQIRSIVGDRPAYLTFDIDCLDPSMAPGTGTPVVGGLTTIEALKILRGLGGLNIVSADVVEVAPAYDVGGVTALAAATVAQNCLALLAAGRFKGKIKPRVE